MRGLRRVAWIAALMSAGCAAARAQDATPPAGQTAAGPVALRRAIELVLQNSKDFQVGKIQAGSDGHAELIGRGQIESKFYVGGGAGYSDVVPGNRGGAGL